MQADLADPEMKAAMLEVLVNNADDAFGYDRGYCILLEEAVSAVPGLPMQLLSLVSLKNGGDGPISYQAPASHRRAQTRRTVMGTDESRRL